MKLKQFRTLAAALISLTLISGVALAAPASAADSRYITISATGSATVVPDAVRINATVSVLGASSKAALASAATTSAAVRKALTSNKVATKDIATQSVTVNPEYSYPASGTPTLSGVSPFVLDDNKATDSARTAAVNKAKAKAASYAKLLGVKLGKVIYLDESSSPSVYPVYTTAAKADSTATVVDLGEQKITVSVTVRWAIG